MSVAIESHAAVDTHPLPAEQCDAQPWSASGMQTALDMVDDAVFFVASSTLELLEANSAACASLGYTHRELLALRLTDIAPQVSRGPVASMLDKVSSGKTPTATIPTVHRRRDGSLFRVELSVRRVAGDTGVYLVVVARDLRDREFIQKLICQEAFRDGLTGLPNRMWFESRLQLGLDRARREPYRFAVLFVDADRFKQVNDTLGHRAGDRVLCRIARHLTANVRPADVVARYGGDEFVVLLDDVHSEREVCRIAERLGRIDDTPAEYGGADQSWLGVTMSIGIAIGGDASTTAEDLIHRADRAMYRAKALGRDGRSILDASTVRGRPR